MGTRNLKRMSLFRKKLVKTLIAIVLILILTLLAVITMLYFEAQSYLNKNLSEFVSKKSEGKYELSFENLKINFSDWGFEIDRVSFHPSDSILRTLPHLNPDKQFYSFSSPNIRFSGIRLIHLILRKNLEIGEIIISQPELNIHGQKSDHEPDDKNNLSTLILELKPLVTKTFKSIKIGKIELANASFDFYSLLGETRKLANAENITIGILNFYTDSLLLPDPNRMFDAKDIYLRMQKYQNKLADSIHSLSAESLTFSLKSSQIEAKNLELIPDNDSISVKDRYQIVVPELKITSRNIRDLYLNNTIPIDSMILRGAKIKYWPGQKNRNSKQNIKEEFNLYELIKNEFSSIHIQNFQLQNAQFMLFKNRRDLNSQQELKNINIDLNDFNLDSISNQDTSRILYSKNIDFSASEYELTLGDNVHRIRVQSLEFSTRLKSVLFRHFQLYPIQINSTKPEQRNIIDATCDSMRLDLFNFKKAYHQKRFTFQKINLFNPEVKLTQNEIAVEKVNPDSPSFIYKLISKYAKGIYSNQVLVQKGKIQLINKTGVLQTGTIESGVKLQLNGFALDELSSSQTDRLFFANQIELKFNNYQMQLVDHIHKLDIESFTLSTSQKLAKIQNLHLRPDSSANIEEMLKKYDRSEIYEFTIPELSLKNADFHNAFFNKKLAVDTLEIKTPQIYYENFAQLKEEKPKADFEDLFQLLANYLYDIRIAMVDIPDGTIRVINHSRKGKTISLDNHFSLGLENMLINQEQFGKKKLLFSEFVDLAVRDHVIQLSDNVHVFKASEIGFSTKTGEVFATNATLYPETDSKNFPSIKWNIQLSIPEVRIKGVNIEELYFDHKIDVDNMLINAPQIKLYQKQKSAHAKEFKEVNFPMPKEIESIAIRKFRLNDGSLKVFSEIGIQPYLLVQSDLNMSGQNIFIKNVLNDRKPEFTDGEYSFQMVQFYFFPKNKNQEYSINELTFSTADRQIQAKQLEVKRKLKSSSEDQFELNIPFLVMNGMDIDNAYQNDQFLFESIKVDKPSFKLYNNSNDSVKFDPFKANLYPYFESFADIFASKSLHVNDAEITIFQNEKKKLQEKISFDLVKLRIENKPSKGFLHAEEFSFRIPKVTRQKKLYKYDIDEISYSSISNLFTARNIIITPNFNKEIYQKQVGFQSDYFEGKIDSIFIVQPNIRKWFDREELVGKMLSVNGLNLNIYRDKRVPFDENRRPKMPQDLMKSAEYSFMIDSFKLINSRINYTEQPLIGDSEGKIRFSEIEARLMPFTNMKSSTGKIPDFRVEATATIMDSCQVKTSMNFQMNHPENLFTATGSLSSFNMHILNPVLEPLAFLSIRSGRVDQFQFKFSADQTKSVGDLFFGYNNLRISVLETKNGNTKESKFASFLANSLMLRSKNPKGKEQLLPNEINFQRDQKRSVINYTWKSVFSGIRNTMGIKDNKQE
jgi:hypothetical protein